VKRAPVAVGHQFLHFLLVGAVGFIVDGGLLMALIEKTSLPALPSRLVSFSVAVTVTWLLNRLLTFRERASSRRLSEWRRYVAVNGLGGAMNLVIFTLLVMVAPSPVGAPFVAFAIASAAAMIFNFVGSRTFAFRRAVEAEGRHDGPPPF